MPTKTFSNPGVWSDPSMIAEVGDIFKVNWHDVQVNSNLKLNDFYKAKFNGKLDERFYPSSRKSNINWDYVIDNQFDLPSKWDHTDDVSIQAIGSPSASLFGNGLNMIQVQINLSPKGSDKADLNINPSVLAESIKLVDYNTGHEYTRCVAPPTFGDEKKMQEGFYYCVDSNNLESPGVVPGGAAVGKKLVVLYLSCIMRNLSQGSQAIAEIGCIITPPKVGATKILNTADGEANNHSAGSVVIYPPRKFDLQRDIVTQTREGTYSPYFREEFTYVKFTDGPITKAFKEPAKLEFVAGSDPNAPSTYYDNPDIYFYNTSSEDYFNLSFFTDTKFEISNSAEMFYPPTFTLSNGEKLTPIGFKNHECYGLCIAFWEGGAWQYPSITCWKWTCVGKFSLYDSFGNECKFSVEFKNNPRSLSVFEFNILN